MNKSRLGLSMLTIALVGGSVVGWSVVRSDPSESEVSAVLAAPAADKLEVREDAARLLGTLDDDVANGVTAIFGDYYRSEEQVLARRAEVAERALAATNRCYNQNFNLSEAEASLWAEHRLAMSFGDGTGLTFERADARDLPELQSKADPSDRNQGDTDEATAVAEPLEVERIEGMEEATGLTPLDPELAGDEPEFAPNAGASPDPLQAEEVEEPQAAIADPCEPIPFEFTAELVAPSIAVEIAAKKITILSEEEAKQKTEILLSACGEDTDDTCRLSTDNLRDLLEIHVGAVERLIKAGEL